MFSTEYERIMFEPIIKQMNLCVQNLNTLSQENLPDVAILNKGFNYKNSNNKQLSFATQDKDLACAEIGYEQRIFKHGLIATRENNWHDFFNAMIWKTFPSIKAAINAVHHREIQAQSSTVRSRVRDLLTLFDESGVIVIANENIINLIKNHQWQELFVKNKDLWLTGKIKIITFGHAMFEKYLNPYIGMTAQALLLTSDESNLDESLAKRLFANDLLLTKSELSPLPMLGIPNWHKNQTDAFYADMSYFR